MSNLALLAKDNKWPLDFIKLKVMRCLQHLCNELARFNCQVNCRFKSLLPFKRLPSLRIFRMESDEERIRITLHRCSCATRISRGRALESFNGLLTEENLLTTLRRYRGRKGLESYFESSRTELTLERICREFLRKLL